MHLVSGFYGYSVVKYHIVGVLRIGLSVCSMLQLEPGATEVGKTKIIDYCAILRLMKINVYVE